MATLSINNLAKAVYESSKGKSQKELDELVLNTALLMKDKRLLGKKDTFLLALEKIIDTEEKIIRVKISTKEKLGEELKRKLEDFIKERYKVKEVIMINSEDPELLGGIKVEIGNEIIDYTLKNRLNKLQSYLIKN